MSDEPIDNYYMNPLAIFMDGWHDSSLKVKPNRLDRPVVAVCSIVHKPFPLRFSRWELMGQTMNIAIFPAIVVSVTLVCHFHTNVCWSVRPLIDTATVHNFSSLLSCSAALLYRSVSLLLLSWRHHQQLFLVKKLQKPTCHSRQTQLGTSQLIYWSILQLKSEMFCPGVDRDQNQS